MYFYKTIMPKLIDFLGIWLISATLLYGLLPDATKEKQGIWTSLIISFLLSVCISIKKNFNRKFGIINKYGLRFNFQILANFIANWILFSLMYYSFLNDSQKGHEIGICIVYGGLVAIGLMGGSVVLRSKIKSKIQNNDEM